MSPELRELLARAVLLVLAIVIPLFIVRSAATSVPELAVPVEGVLATDLRDSFDEPRDGQRKHGAIDIEAPAGTPVVAAAGGVVRQIASSPLGGLGVTVVDRARRRCYYYGHLASYVSGLAEGKPIGRGEVLGFVGSTGNASEDTPHLHFAVLALRANGACALDEPVNPYPRLTER